MDKSLQIALYDSNNQDFKYLCSLLEKQGYVLHYVLDDDFINDKVILLPFVIETKKEDFLSLSFLKNQYEKSTIQHLKIMPVFIYDSRQINSEEAFEDKIGEIYDDVFSGEFKPFGFDVEDKYPLKEFERILEQYDE